MCAGTEMYKCTNHGPRLMHVRLCPVRIPGGPLHTLSTRIAITRTAHAVASPPPPLLLPPLLLPSSELRLGLKSPPRISSVSPLSGPRAGGTRLTISGSHLGTHAADVLNVTLGTVACEEMRFVSPHQLQCSAPPAAAVGTTPV